MSITRTTDTNDDGTGSTGTIHDNAWLQAIYDVVDARWSRTTTSSTGTQTVINPSEADLLICNNASDLTIRSITAPASPAKPGKRLVIISTGAGNVFLNHQDTTGTTAANRLINFATSGTTPLAAGSGCAVYVYDDNASRWRLVAHEQGAWITTTFSAGNFTGNGSMTWTVDSGDVTTLAWKLVGRTVTVSAYIGSTTVGGTLNTSLQIGNGAWGGFTAAKQMLNMAVLNDAGAGNSSAFVQVAASATVIGFFKTAGGNWSAATNTTATVGTLTFEVT